jgi:hypothetical protein
MIIASQIDGPQLLEGTIAKPINDCRRICDMWEGNVWKEMDRERSVHALWCSYSMGEVNVAAGRSSAGQALSSSVKAAASS